MEIADSLLDIIRDVSGVSALLTVFGEEGVGGGRLPGAFILMSEHLDEAVKKLDKIEKEVRK